MHQIRIKVTEVKRAAPPDLLETNGDPLRTSSYMFPCPNRNVDGKPYDLRSAF